MRLSAVMPVITIATCAAVSLTSCGNNEKEVSFKSDGVTHTFSEGDAAKSSNFPLPLYPNAKPTGAVSAKGDGDENSSFMILTSSDKLEAVSSFYSDKLKADGWTVNVTTTMPKLVNISASKKDTEANVMLGVDEASKTTITLAVSKESSTPTKVTKGDYTPDKLNPPTD
jgi:hypothetical protein